MTLARFLTSLAERTHAADWLVDAAFVEVVKTNLLDAVTERVHTHIGQWTALSRAFPESLGQPMPEALRAAVKHTLDGWARHTGRSTESDVASVLTLLSERCDDIGALADNAVETNHGLADGLEVLGEEDLPALLRAMPRGLLDAHTSAFQRALLAWWSESRRRTLMTVEAGAGDGNLMRAGMGAGDGDGDGMRAGDGMGAGAEADLRWVEQ